jgi:hypothetical protein
VGQFGRQHAFSQHLFKLASQAGFPENGLGIFILDLG